MKTNISIPQIVKITGIAAFAIILMAFLKPDDAKAQELSTGVDLYSTYVFRGIAYSGPSIQPSVEFTAGGFAIGAWGSQGIDGNAGSPGFQEMDLYTSYSFDFGLSLGLTDYYYPGSPYGEEDSHALELNLGYSIGDLSLAGNYIFNEATSAGSLGEDMYFEAGYSAGAADLFIGAGDGWHSTDGDFALVNLGIGTSKDIVITDSFSLPLNGAVIYNPDSEQFYIVAGITL
ncbi:TorF family putative porin [Rhodohalobacter sp. 8-1]|uniref:TorF family putative porin n=1 Tax=Rhodohalobacter sp. 8-1 TaxID=3131972 RepID=UPI0030EE244F